MKIIFLGTGTSQGVPVIGCKCQVCQSVDRQDQRLRSSIYIEIDDLCLVIDTGPDFRQQMLQNRIHKLDAVLYTHAHKDHTAGMDDIRSFNFLQQMDMPVYGEDLVIAQLKQEFSYVFADVKYPGIPRVVTHTISDVPFKISETKIIPIRVLHHKLPILGFRFGNFTYITDANNISDESKKLVQGSEVLVLNALQRTTHISHFNLSEALNLIQELQPQKAYLTHISHRLGTHRNISKELPEKVSLAWDGLQVTC